MHRQISEYHVSIHLLILQEQYNYSTSFHYFLLQLMVASLIDCALCRESLDLLGHNELLIKSKCEYNIIVLACPDV